MNTTCIEEHEFCSQNPTSVASDDVLKVRKGDQEQWRKDLSCWFTAVPPFFLLIGFFIFCGYELPPMCIAIGLGGSLAVVVIWNATRKYIQSDEEGEIELTLTETCLLDHRTGVSVEFENVDSIRLNRGSNNGFEFYANLHVTTKDGVERVFDLKELEPDSRVIAWRVTKNSGITDAKGVIATTDPKPLGLAGVIALLIFGLVFLGCIVTVVMAR